LTFRLLNEKNEFEIRITQIQRHTVRFTELVHFAACAVSQLVMQLRIVFI